MLSGVQRLLNLPEQQPSFVAHRPLHALVIDLTAIDLESNSDPSVAKGGSVFYNKRNDFFRSGSSALAGDFLKSA
jgi:hypothetical protein